MTCHATDHAALLRLHVITRHMQCTCGTPCGLMLMLTHEPGGPTSRLATRHCQQHTFAAHLPGCDSCMLRLNVPEQRAVSVPRTAPTGVGAACPPGARPRPALRLILPLTLRPYILVVQLVYSSTCAVYGNPASLPVTEATPPLPINPYGQSKLMAEEVSRREQQQQQSTHNNHNAHACACACPRPRRRPCAHPCPLTHPPPCPFTLQHLSQPTPTHPPTRPPRPPLSSFPGPGLGPAPQVIRWYAKSRPSFQAIILRYFNVYGSDPDARLGVGWGVVGCGGPGGGGARACVAACGQCRIASCVSHDAVHSLPCNWGG